MTALPELGVVGWPLKMTFSPLMQQAALQEVGLEWRYEAIPVPPEGFSAFFERASGIMHGFNVTMPHKAAAQRLCSVLDGLSAASGVVNTVLFVKGTQCPVSEGHNTDGPGLIRALAQRASFDTRGSCVVVFGAGGAAAGCVTALARSGAGRIIIANRTVARAEELISRMKPMFPETKWQTCPLNSSEWLNRHIAEADLLINCIPEDGAAELAALFCELDGRGKAFCDLSYSGEPGTLFRACKEAGFAAVPGLEVLLWQGVFAFELFTQRSAPVNVMRRALCKAAGEWWL
ncbi:MAG TPA: hypothetical protein GXX40_03230 [Firmicutes bacterium]|nr:hypothetical protein [Bacillota bacterium]